MKPPSTSTLPRYSLWTILAAPAAHPRRLGLAARCAALAAADAGLLPGMVRAAAHQAQEHGPSCSLCPVARPPAPASTGGAREQVRKSQRRTNLVAGAVVLASGSRVCHPARRRRSFDSQLLRTLGAALGGSKTSARAVLHHGPARRRSRARARRGDSAARWLQRGDVVGTFRRARGSRGRAWRGDEAPRGASFPRRSTNLCRVIL